MTDEQSPNGSPPKKRGRKPRVRNDLARVKGTQPGPLTPKGQVSRAAHTTATKFAEKAERREKAMRLYIDQRLTFEQVGKQLGVSTKTACIDVQEAVAEIKDRTAQMAEAYVEVEIERTHQIDRPLLPLMYGQVPAKQRRVTRTVDGEKVETLVPIANDPVHVANLQIKAARQLLSNSERRARLLGIDAPTKIAPTDPSGTRRYAGLSLSELEDLVNEREELLNTIDVVPVSGSENGGGDGG